MDKPVGFIGLGMMGQPMARCLLGRGFRLLACDSASAARDALAQDAPPGALAFAGSPAALAEDCDAIVLMLPTSAAVSAVLEAGGLLAALRPGALVIDMGSSIPA